MDRVGQFINCPTRFFIQPHNLLNDIFIQSLYLILINRCCNYSCVVIRLIH